MPSGPDPTPCRTEVERRAYLAGDLAAGERLFARHRPALLACARRHRLARALRPYCSAGEIVHEVYLRFLPRLAEFEAYGPGKLQAYLGDMVKSTMVSRWRHENAQRRRPNGPTVSCGEGEESVDVPAPDPTPSEAPRYRELVALCREALPLEEREVWELVDLEGLTSVEAGERLQLTDAAVRGRLMRARKRLAPIVARRLGREPEAEDGLDA